MSAGHRVGGGRLRVDAARAVDKLRDYQLPDPTLWVLEVVRAAVLAKATCIDVRGDADDVVVGWEGPPIDPTVLTRLFDELVDPAAPADRRHLRLLATGVNTALGLDPRWIDLVVLDGSGEAQAVRYTPRILERTGEVAEGLRSLTVTRGAPPAFAPARGVAVHLRRFPMLSAMPIAVGIGEPHEVTLVRRACEDIGVPLVVGGRSLVGRERSHEDLLRVTLGEGLDGFLALVDPTFAHDRGRLEVAELGVQLARYTLRLPGLEEPRVRVPLRLFVDAPRMPTNASRSAVRLDEPPVRDALARAPELLVELVKRLVVELGDRSAHDWTPVQRERLREAALALLAAVVAGEDWRTRVRALPGKYGAAVAPLAELPLVRDAVGRFRAPVSFSTRVGTDAVWRALEPAPAELGPWLGELLWVPPGDAAARLCGDWVAPSAGSWVERARAAKVARERWLREPVLPPTVPERSGQLLAVPLKGPGRSLRSVVPVPVFAIEKLRGEVVIGDPRASEGSVVSLRVEGRELERVELGLPLPVTAVAHAPGLRPTLDHRSVDRDAAYDAVLRAVHAAVVVACEAVAWQLLGTPKPGARASARGTLDPVVGVELVRAALASAVRLLDADTVRRSSTPLLDAPSVRTLEGELRPAREVLEAADRGVVRWVSPRARGTLSGRAFVLDARERATFEALVGPLALVDCEPALRRPAIDVSTVAVPPGSAGLLLHELGRRVQVAWTDGAASIEVLHLGRRLFTTLSLGARTRLRAVVDDDALVPGPGFQSAREKVEYPEAEWERALARAYVDALCGEEPPGLIIDADHPLRAAVAMRSLLELLRAVHPVAALGQDRVERLRNVPLVTRLGLDDLVSVEALVKAHDGEIPFVPRSVVPQVDLGDFHPARLEADEAEALAKIAGRPFVLASDELARRLRSAARMNALARHRDESEHPPPLWTAQAIELTGRRYRRALVTLGTHRSSEVEVLVEGRLFQRRTNPRGLPVRAVIDFDATAVDETFADLTPAAERTLHHVLVRGTRELLVAVAERDPSALWGPGPASMLLRAWAAEAGAQAADRKLAEQLAEARGFPMVHGPLGSVREASTSHLAVRVAAWSESWLGPEGERPSVYDEGVLRLPSDDAPRSELERVLSVLAPGGVRDVTGAVARLQATRRVARGLVRAPRLASVKDARFRYPLSELLADEPEAMDALGLGEAALGPGNTARLHLFESGIEQRVLDFELVPRVMVAAESPLAPRGRALLRGATLDALQRAMQAVSAHLVRRVVDTTPPEQLPPWLRRELRESCLIGETEARYEGLADTPMFETTAGAWVSPRELRAQADRFGPIGWTSAPVDWGPLDEDRFALRLDVREARQLGKWIAVADATRELELDRVARANRARPAIASLDPSEAEQAASLAVVRLEPEGEGDTARGVIALLRPGSHRERALHLYRDMRLLATTTDPCHWPTLARVDDPALVPNRTWDGAEETVPLSALRQRVRALVERELRRLLPIPHRTRAHLRVRALPRSVFGVAEEVALDGVAWLDGPPSEPGRVALLDDAGERVVVPVHEGRPLPVSGTLWLHGAIGSDALAGRLMRPLYARMLERLASSLGEEPLASSLELAHVLHGVACGAVEPSSSAALPCFVAGECTVKELFARVRAGERVVLASPDEAQAAVLVHPSDVLPILVDDGSPVATALTAALAGALVPFRGALRERVLGERAEPLPPPVAAGAADGLPAAGGAAGAVLAAGGAADEHGLERALLARLQDAGVTAVKLVLRARRKRPLVAVSDGVLTLAGDHAEVRALREAVERRAASRDARLALFVARAVGALHRAGDVGVEAEHAVLRALLEQA